MATTAVLALEKSAAVYQLRCHSCSHGLGHATETMRFVAMFKASLFGRMSGAPVGERRCRCGHCGWVNVFQPLTAQRIRD
jgi:hypothetical protein